LLTNVLKKQTFNTRFILVICLSKHSLSKQWNNWWQQNRKRLFLYELSYVINTTNWVFQDCITCIDLFVLFCQHPNVFLQINAFIIGCQVPCWVTNCTKVIFYWLVRCMCLAELSHYSGPSCPSLLCEPLSELHRRRATIKR
jgi:hypothetical protein